MSDRLTIQQRRLLVIVLLFTVLVRLFTLGAYPLADTTEARSAEIARKMVETDNWVTPLEDNGVPFWAKPPLSTWLTAICFKFFGVNEFTARLSSFLLAEARTPGFLNYFFIGEHFGKFTDSGWKGDRFGTEHGKPRGMIWLYWLAAAIPWSLAVLFSLVRRRLRPQHADLSVPRDLCFTYLLGRK